MFTGTKQITFLLYTEPGIARVARKLNLDYAPAITQLYVVSNTYKLLTLILMTLSNKNKL